MGQLAENLNLMLIAAVLDGIVTRLANALNSRSRSSHE
jgi:hypothetical protein